MVKRVKVTEAKWKKAKKKAQKEVEGCESWKTITRMGHPLSDKIIIKELILSANTFYKLSEPTRLMGIQPKFMSAISRCKREGIKLKEFEGYVNKFGNKETREAWKQFKKEKLWERVEK